MALRSNFCSTFLYRATDFSWHYPSTWSTKQSDVTSNIPLPKQTVVKEALDALKYTLTFCLLECKWTQIFLKMLWIPICSAIGLLQLKLTQHEVEHAQYSPRCALERDSILLDTHTRTHAEFLIWSNVILPVPMHTENPRLSIWKVDGSVKSLTWNLQ